MNALSPYNIANNYITTNTAWDNLAYDSTLNTTAMGHINVVLNGCNNVAIKDCVIDATHGSFTITTDDGVEIGPTGYARRPPPLEFNRYINASDLMEEFIAFVGEHGVRQGEVFELPVEMFIKWLVIRACEEDQEEAPVTLELPAPRRRTQPRCARCKRFMPRNTAVPLHGGRCANRYFETRELVARDSVEERGRGLEQPSASDGGVRDVVNVDLGRPSSTDAILSPAARASRADEQARVEGLLKGDDGDRVPAFAGADE